MQKDTKKIFFVNNGPECSTQRSARLRERRFNMAYQKREMSENYINLQEKAKEIYLENAIIDPGLARALALKYVVENCDITLEEDTVFLGGDLSKDEQEEVINRTTQRI